MRPVYWIRAPKAPAARWGPGHAPHGRPSAAGGRALRRTLERLGPDPMYTLAGMTADDELSLSNAVRTVAADYTGGTGIRAVHSLTRAQAAFLHGAASHWLQIGRTSADLYAGCLDAAVTGIEPLRFDPDEFADVWGSDSQGLRLHVLSLVHVMILAMTAAARRSPRRLAPVELAEAECARELLRAERQDREPPRLSVPPVIAAGIPATAPRPGPAFAPAA